MEEISFYKRPWLLKGVKTQALCIFAGCISYSKYYVLPCNTYLLHTFIIVFIVYLIYMICFIYVIIFPPGEYPWRYSYLM